MATPSLSNKERLRRKSLYESLLQQGYAPIGVAGGKGSANQRASLILGVSAGTLSTWVRKEEALAEQGKEHYVPNWELYQKDESIPEITINSPPDPDQKPTVRVRYVPDDLDDHFVVAIGDAHDSPRYDKERFYWIGRHIQTVKPTDVIQIGDFFTFDSLCSHVSNDTLEAWKEKPSFKEDLASGAQALQRFEDGLGAYKMAEKHVCLGNHEDRIWSWENRNPESQDILKHELDRLLASHGWSYSLFGMPHFLGGVAFSHVPLTIMGKPMGGEQTSNSVTLKSTHDWVYGHSHRADAHRRPKIGVNNWVTAINLGCALPQNVIEPYAKLATTGWWYGIYELRISGGKIQSYAQITMAELEARYGSRKA